MYAQELQDQIVRKERELADLRDTLKRVQERQEREKYNAGAIWKGNASGGLYMRLLDRKVVRLTPGSGISCVGDISDPEASLMSLTYVAPSLKEAKEHI